ncbi:DUF3732 domain-containing protein [Quadrisphaera granulorum]|uniref:DUF3732 domain-containing protein n=1 Tax=Quadrisphaera granulorum TaxID=317664 RepID=UPI0011B3DF24|nr:DUF3732 domain-containing protein [Quadrisphaera granulorum]
MQLVSIVVWGWSSPEPRVIALRPGLNVITGDSKTGKSAILDIVDYCFGRREESVAGERIREAVSWYGVVLRVAESFVFVGRPRPSRGSASNHQALIRESTSPDLPVYEDLLPNTDTEGLRRRLGLLLGIGEHRAFSHEDALAAGGAASAGNAIVLCLQKQGEVSNQDYLFHRQADRNVANSLIDSLPYFLGAERWDQAVWQARARQDRRVVDAQSVKLRNAEKRAEGAEGELRALLEEAFAVGLLPSTNYESREQAVALLKAAATRGDGGTVSRDGAAHARRLDLQERAAINRRQLRHLIDQRSALQNFGDDEDLYGEALARQRIALRSLELSSDGGDSVTSCPLCSQGLEVSDPRIDEMQSFADQIGADLSGLVGNRPRRAEALSALGDQISALQEELSAIDVTVAALQAADSPRLFGQSRAEEIAFHRGRIDAALGGISQSGEEALDRARAALRDAERALEVSKERAGESETDVEARLVAISQYLTELAGRLDVEHSDRPITLDIKKLTTIVSTDSGRLRLNQVGSASNYLGLHLAAHLALHRFFIEESRPVPRFLMLDQPSQPFYPQDDTQGADGELPAGDSDRRAVRDMYRLLFDFAQERGQAFQVIVSDHVNLRDEQWFQESIVEEWRDGNALIPAEWRKQGEA